MAKRSKKRAVRKSSKKPKSSRKTVGKSTRPKSRAKLTKTRRLKKTSAVHSRSHTKSPKNHSRTEHASLFTFAPPRSSSTRIFAKSKPWLRLESTRRAAYYGMGTVALVGGLTFLVTQSIKEPPIPAEEFFRSDNGKAKSGTSYELVPEKPESLVVTSSLESLGTEFRSAAQMHLDQRIAFWSEYIEKSQRNRDRLLSLNSGHEIEDSEPIVPRVYDCTTFVETVVALAKSDQPEDFFRNLMAIRYKNSRSNYLSRNHFPEADWIPNNEKADLLTDITSRIAEGAGLTAKVEIKTIDRASWLKSQISKHSSLRSLASVNETTWPSLVDAHLSYIAVKDVDAVIQEIPSGAVVNLVHKNDGVHPVLITHQGLILKKRGQVLIRHASRDGKIRTSDFSSYLKRMAKSATEKNPNWPLLGVNFNLIKSASDQGFKESKASNSETKRRKASM
ncbi:MAG: DUF1460 domain-containing protein [Bdellovibrio sp.]|nr:DUF1460 domain-containing protein [Bdellovibrio sp.]